MAELKTQQKEVGGFRNGPPISEKKALKTAYVLIEGLASTTPEKKEIANNALIKMEKGSKFSDDRYEKSLIEKDGHAKELFAEKEFKDELFTFIKMQAMKFISIRNAFNKEKENIQSYYESRIKAPQIYEFLQKSFPWLAGTGLIVGAKGSALWGAISNWIHQNWLPEQSPQVVQDAFDLFGIGILGGFSLWINRRTNYKKAKLAQECEQEKKKIDSMEEDVKRKILNLIEIEAQRLTFNYHYNGEEEKNVEEKNRDAKEQSEKIIEAVKLKYGFVLPYIDSDPINEVMRRKTIVQGTGDAVLRAITSIKTGFGKIFPHSNNAVRGTQDNENGPESPNL
jgi:hypothetical protein